MLFNQTFTHSEAITTLFPQFPVHIYNSLNISLIPPLSIAILSISLASFQLMWCQKCIKCKFTGCNFLINHFHDHVWSKTLLLEHVTHCSCVCWHLDLWYSILSHECHQNVMKDYGVYGLGFKWMYECVCVYVCECAVILN